MEYGDHKNKSDSKACGSAGDRFLYSTQAPKSAGGPKPNRKRTSHAYVETCKGGADWLCGDELHESKDPCAALSAASEKKIRSFGANTRHQFPRERVRDLRTQIRTTNILFIPKMAL